MKAIWKALAFLATMGAAALAVSASAFAVGGGSGPSPARWRLSVGPAGWSGRLTALYPGVRGDAELLGFTITNAGRARQAVGRVVASVPAAADGDARTAAGADIRGCRAKWFTVVIDRADRPLPAALAPGAAYRGKVGLSMGDSGTNQNGCRGAAPAVTVSVTAG
jgi:hypothetical protein